METCCILYNPKAGNGRGLNEARRLDSIWSGKSLDYIDVTAIADIRAYLDSLPAETTVVLAGGDGTLNHFINDWAARRPHGTSITSRPGAATTSCAMQNAPGMTRPSCSIRTFRTCRPLRSMA